MPDTQQQQHARPQYTHDQLHALACIVCGRTDGELLPDGYVHTPGLGGWPVVACPEHQEVPR